MNEGVNYIMDGRLIMASTALYQSIFGMWFVVILFLLFKFILWNRTRNVALGFTTSILFIGVATTGSLLVNSGTEFLQSQAFIVVVTITIFEMASVLYGAIWKK